MGNTLHRVTLRSLTAIALMLAATPFVTGFPCERTTYVNDCTIVMQSALPDAEKLDVVAGMIDDTYAWNTQFIVHDLPEGTRIVNDGVVRNAWIRIFAVMPSAYQNETLLSPGYGTVVAKGAYTVEKPTGTERGDCKTTYPRLDHNSEIQHTLNDKAIGTGETARFNTTASMFDIHASLVIHTELTVKHYRLQRVGKRLVCAFSRTEIRKRTTTVTDSLRAVRHEPKITYSFNATKTYFGITQATFTAANQSWFRLQFGPETFYEEHTAALDPFFTLKPYYTLHYRVQPVVTVTHRNLRYDNNTFQITTPTACEITLGDLFQAHAYPCSTNSTTRTDSIEALHMTAVINTTLWNDAATLGGIALAAYLLWHIGINSLRRQA